MAGLIFSFQPGASPLHRLDVRVKLAALLAVSLTSLQLGHAALALALSALLLLLARAGWPPLSTLVALRWYLLLLAIVVCSQALTTAGEPLLPISWLPASRQGLEVGLLSAGRLLLVALAGLLLTVTSRPAALRAAVEWLLRPIPLVPHRQAATMVGLLVRFIPVILSQAAELKEALRARAIEESRRPLRRLTALGLPLLRRTFLTADRLTAAMEARCYGAELQRDWPSLGTRDWAALALVGCCCLALLLLSLW